MFERAGALKKNLARQTKVSAGEPTTAKATSRIPIQAKFVVGAANDSAEQEADRIAQEVVDLLGRPEQAEQAVDATVRRATRISRRATIDSAGGILDGDTEQQILRARSGGHPLDSRIRRSMEGAFGADFSRVRVHVGEQSDELNSRIQARAFTTGSDIFVRRQDYAPGTTAGNTLLAHELTHTLQQGGATVSRSIQREPDAEAGAETALAEEESEAAEAESDDGTAATAQFSIGTVAPPEAEFTIGEELWKEDGASHSRQGRARQIASAGSPRRRSRTLEVVPNFSTSHSVSERSGEADEGPMDAVNMSKVVAKTSTTGGSNVKAFGSESTKFTMAGLTVTWKKNKILVDGTLNGDFFWGVNSGGKLDVPSATDPIVTSANYKQIVSDLTPALDEKSWRAPRSTYWSQAICERHEQYHAKDDTKWFESKGKGIIAKYFKVNPIELAEGDSDDLSIVKTKTEAAMSQALKALGAANMEFYKGGASSYLSYAGEERAFGDGKAPYLKLASDIGKQGAKLEKTAAKVGK